MWGFFSTACFFAGNHMSPEFVESVSSQDSLSLHVFCQSFSFSIVCSKQDSISNTFPLSSSCNHWVCLKTSVHFTFSHSHIHGPLFKSGFSKLSMFLVSQFCTPGACLKSGFLKLCVFLLGQSPKSYTFVLKHYHFPGACSKSLLPKLHVLLSSDSHIPRICFNTSALHVSS
jgi:hypothetical protein